MEQRDPSRGAHPSDPAEGAGPDEDANSPTQQRKSVQETGGHQNTRDGGPPGDGK
jgi:hypothetical protein